MIKKRTWEVHEKKWGRELWLENNSLYCGKLLMLDQRFMCSYHRHPIKTETFTVLSGRVILVVGNECVLLNPSECVTIPRKTWHQFIGVDDVNVIVETSTPHMEQDVQRSSKSIKLKLEPWVRYLKAVGINIETVDGFKKPSASGHSASSISHALRVPTSQAESRNGQRSAGSRQRYSGSASGKAEAGRHGGSSKARKGGRGSAAASPSGSTRKPRRSSRDTSSRSGPAGDMLL